MKARTERDDIFMRLHLITAEHTRRVLGVTPEEFERIKHPSPKDLHDPFHLKGMRETVNHLYRMKKLQAEDPTKLLVVVPDYDTDGVTAAAILTASLSIFGIKHRIYAPHSKYGYGLSTKAIDEIRESYEVDGYKVSMILTADNGISANSAVAYANKLGIPVLITDHHLPPKRLPDALAIINPNCEGDLYPFKGSAGATVAWKLMMAYAQTCDKERVGDIGKLIVFAGLANVADFMPILDENRYMVKMAVDYINRIREIDVTDNDYSVIMNTDCEQYNAVFYGLYDLVTLIQKSKDDARLAKGKKPYPLPYDEEIIGWYLSPLLNAPRRVRGTSIESMVSLLATDHALRQTAVKTVIQLNDEKSVMRDRVVNTLDDDAQQDGSVTVLCANTKSGISGLIAGMIANKTGAPAVVFSYENEHDETIIYDQIPKQAFRLGASARSNDLYPLDKIIERVNELHPNLVSGGGHAAAAGMSIKASDYDTFVKLFEIASTDVYKETIETIGDVEEISNHITLSIVAPDRIVARYNIMDGVTGELLTEEHVLNADTFAKDVIQTMEFQDSLRPFGQAFMGETTFSLEFNDFVADMNWNPDFWKTFKFDVHGVEVLTFDEKWANKVKESLKRGESISATIKLSLNEFRGRVTPQFILSE